MKTKKILMWTVLSIVIIYLIIGIVNLSLDKRSIAPHLKVVGWVFSIPYWGEMGNDALNDPRVCSSQTDTSCSQSLCESSDGVWTQTKADITGFCQCPMTAHWKTSFGCDGISNMI